MEVKEGYKNSEVGLIPKEWNLEAIGKLCCPSKSRIDPKVTEIQYKCVELEHISQETGRLLGYSISNESASQKSLFTKGDILFGKLRPYLRKYLLAEFDGACSTEIWVLQAGRAILNQFLFYIVQSSRFLEAANLSTGTKMPRAEWKTVSETTIALPEIPEQQAIAEVLTDTDNLIQALEKQIAKKRLIKQGVMQKLLTPKEGWVKKRLGDVCSIYGRIGFRGYTINDIVKKHEGAISLSPSNIIDNKLDFSKCTYISWDKYNESPEIKVYEGDIVFVKTASIGKTALVKKLPQETTLNPQLIVFKDIKINNALLSYFLSFKDFQNHIKAILVGGVVPTLSQTQIANFLISYPNSKLEQDEVAGFLMDIDSEIENLEQKLAKVTFLKQGLMQQLLTGKIRLNQL